MESKMPDVLTERKKTEISKDEIKARLRTMTAETWEGLCDELVKDLGPE